MRLLFKKVFLFIELFIILTSISLAQEIYIKKIIDTNLFELNNGQKVTIYGLYIPSLTNMNELNKNLAKEIFEWEIETIANKIFNIKFVDKEGDIKKIKLYKQLADSEIDIAAWFLSKGYASLLSNNEDYNYLLSYELEAHKNKIGIWKTASSEKNIDNNVIKEKLYQYSKQYERPYLYLIPLSIASFALAWDSFTSASDIQKSIDLFKALKQDAKDLETSKTRKTLIGITCLAAGVFTAILSFKEIEVRTNINTITMSYKF